MPRRASGRSVDELEALLAERERERAELARETEELRRDRNQAREQQAATSEVLQVIGRSPASVQPVAEAIVDWSCRLCGADNASVRLLEGDRMRVIANRWGELPREVDPEEWQRVKGMLPVGQLQTLEDPDSPLARAIAERRTQYESDLRESRGASHSASRVGLRAVANVPMLREGIVVGALAVRSFRPRAFSAEDIRLLETFATQAVIAIENARLFQELQERLEEQTATAEVLRVIASAPTDQERVLGTILASAARLSGAPEGFLRVIEGDRLVLRASHGPAMGAWMSQTAIRSQPILPAGTDRNMTQIALARRATVRFDTVDSEPDLPEPARQTCRRLGLRSMIAVPLMRLGEPIGAMLLARTEEVAFSDAEVALVESFADQAVIAIENARLFAELQERLEEQTATTDVLRVISESPGDLGPVLEAGLVMVRERATRGGVALSLEVAADVGVIEADERKVKQVLFNLLTNAVKFTPTGGTVTVSARQEDGRVEVAVNDTGVGIAPEEQARVFEEFSQARSASGHSEGTGLGLTLCKRFVELHGGTIAVASEVGRGSTFTVSLPVRQPTPPVGPPGQP
jgi:signal transduction histidine kinase